MIAFVYYLIIGISSSFVLSFVIGINDVSYLASTTTVTKVFPILFVNIIFCLCEVIGTLLFGQFVSRSLGSTFFDIHSVFYREDQLNEYMGSMIIVLCSACILSIISIATPIPLPSSYTIVSSLSVIAIILWKFSPMANANIKFTLLAQYIVNWLICPILACLMAMILWYLMKRFIVGSGASQLSSPSPKRMVYFFTPMFALVLFYIGFIFLYFGTRIFMDMIAEGGYFYVPFYGAMTISALFALVISLMIYIFVVPLIENKIERERASFVELQETSKRFSKNREIDDDHHFAQQSTVDSLMENADEVIDETKDELVIKHLEYSDTNEDDKSLEQTTIITGEQQNSREEEEEEEESLAIIEQRYTDEERDDDEKSLDVEVDLLIQDQKCYASLVEKYFFGILVFTTTCLLSMSHGANDGSQPIGPVVSIVVTSLLGYVPVNGLNFIFPFWVHMISAGGLFVGLATLGYKALERKVPAIVSEFTLPKAFVAQLCTSIIVFSAALSGIPLSTSHVYTGAILGIHAMEVSSKQDFNWKKIVGIIIGGTVAALGGIMITVPLHIVFRFFFP